MYFEIKLEQLLLSVKVKSIQDLKILSSNLLTCRKCQVVLTANYEINCKGKKENITVLLTAPISRIPC